MFKKTFQGLLLGNGWILFLFKLAAIHSSTSLERVSSNSLFPPIFPFLIKPCSLSFTYPSIFSLVCTGTFFLKLSICK
uniref:Uncharacterized protein n=1 Tax=Panstrongylus lignarius TaxID=156445 RepID=A0A224XT27_9HEMI